jgi:L-ascorbate metabolism protein UlaG (beta-lactamase superfamily)
MKLRYLGHAAFELVSEVGVKVIFDPYEPGAYDGALQYGPISGRYNIAVVSHDHADHRDPGVTARAANVVDGPGTFDFEGIRVVSWPTFHDESGGSERGKNLVSVVELDGMRIAHLGDLGHQLETDELEALGSVDVLLIPVGGHFTIDAVSAAGLIGDIGPGIAIPMHFKTEKVAFPIASVDEFTDLMENVEVTGGSELTVTKEDVPEATKVVVLESAL